MSEVKDGIKVRCWSPEMLPKEGRYGCVGVCEVCVEPCVGLAGTCLVRGAETSSECTTLCLCGGRLGISAEFP